MDKLIFSVAQNIAPKEPMVVRLDNEASSMLYDIMCKTSMERTHIISEMVKFCYSRIEIKHVKMCLVEDTEQVVEMEVQHDE